MIVELFAKAQGHLGGEDPVLGIRPTCYLAPRGMFACGPSVLTPPRHSVSFSWAEWSTCQLYDPFTD